MEEQQTHTLRLRGMRKARVAVPEELTAELHATGEPFCEDI